MDHEDDFSTLGLRAFGVPEEDDKKLIRFLREEFRKADADWGGLEPRKDGKFSRIWAHPQAAPAGGH